MFWYRGGGKIRRAAVKREHERNYWTVRGFEGIGGMRDHPALCKTEGQPKTCPALAGLSFACVGGIWVVALPCGPQADHAVDRRRSAR